MKRERLKWRGRGESKAGAGLTVIALCWKQQDTSKPWPALLLLALCPSPSIPLISLPSSLLPLLLFKLCLRFCFTPSELRFTQLSASCYLFFTHTHTDCGHYSSGASSKWTSWDRHGVFFPCFHGTGLTRRLLFYFTMETCNVTITLSLNPVGLTPYHLIKFSLMAKAVNIRIADVIMHSHSTFIARATTDAHFLICFPHFLLFPFSPTWKWERNATPA